MTSKREEVLSALHDLVATLEGVTVERNSELRNSIPEGGLIILRDGSPGEPEVTLSPLTYHFEHRAEIEVFVQARTGRRDADWDDLARRLGEVLIGHRTLGGRCAWVEPEAVEPSDLYVAGGDGIKAATITVMLRYDTTNPLI